MRMISGKIPLVLAIVGLLLVAITVANAACATSAPLVPHAPTEDSCVYLAPLAPHAPTEDSYVYLPLVVNNPCDVTLTPNSVVFDSSNVQPGSVICLQAGEYGKIEFTDIKGTAQNPITIRNDGGQVRVTGDDWVYVKNCQHIHLTGTGDPGTEYGFYFQQVLRAHQQSHHLEIDHVETTARFDIKEDPDDPGSDPDFVMTNIHVHHCYFHDIDNTAIYIGKPWDLKPPNTYLVQHVEVDHNRLDNIGHKGIQLPSCIEDCRIHHNFLTNQVQGTWHDVMAAIMITEHSAIDVYSNIIVGCKAAGIAAHDDTYHHDIYNNLLIDCGQSHTHDQQDAMIIWNDNYSVFNNTIIGANRHGIAFATGADPTNNEAYNNIVLDTANDSIQKGGSSSNNFHHNHTKEDGYTVENYHFTDPLNGDYHLTDGCDGIDAGDSSGPDTDQDNTPRPQGNDYDIGCYEYIP